MSFLFLLIALVAGVRATTEVVDDWTSASTAAWLAFTLASAAMSIAIHNGRRPKPLVLTPAKPRHPRCQVHDTTPSEYDQVLRYSTNILCTCHPIHVAATPPTEPAMPPTRRSASGEGRQA